MSPAIGIATTTRLRLSAPVAMVSPVALDRAVAVVVALTAASATSRSRLVPRSACKLERAAATLTRGFRPLALRPRQRRKVFSRSTASMRRAALVVAVAALATSARLRTPVRRVTLRNSVGQTPVVLAVVRQRRRRQVQRPVKVALVKATALAVAVAAVSQLVERLAAPDKMDSPLTLVARAETTALGLAAALADRLA
jgi:hypothetical protein